MKKIDVITKGRKFTDKLLGLKKRQIKRVLEAAQDSAEKQKEDASVAYEELVVKLADDDADYQSIVAKMLEHKQTCLQADNTIAAIQEIANDLNSEVPEDED